MDNEDKQPLNDSAAWILLGCVFLVVVTIILAVFNHEKQKPDSPQAVAAAAFNRIIATQEWKPGMGPQPLIYHPAAATQPVWQPLPPRSGQMQQGAVPQPFMNRQATGGQPAWQPLPQR
ncbi:MAG: hypothetical protein WCQ99_06890 [Pseudomonadota bacterium]